MDKRRCGLVLGTTVGLILLAWITGIFMPSALAPQRIFDGGTRVLIAVSIVLVAAMAVVSTCRRDQDEGPIAKTEAETRNKTTR